MTLTDMDNKEVDIQNEDNDERISLGTPYSHATAPTGDNVPWGVVRTRAGVLPTHNTGSVDNTLLDGTGVTMFVIDSGIPEAGAEGNLNVVHRKKFHPDELNNVVSSDDSVQKKIILPSEGGVYHGIHVAGTIAATVSGRGVMGVAPGVDIIDLDVFDDSGGGSSYVIMEAVNYVDTYINENNIDPRTVVVNMSLGGPQYEDSDNFIRNIADTGVSFVIAAGNEDQDVDNVSPAAAGEHENVYTIAATDNNDYRASFSNWDDEADQSLTDTERNAGKTDDCDFAAPGKDIKSLDESGNLLTISGTSMAAPHFAGLLALYIQWEIFTGNLPTNSKKSRPYLNYKKEEAWPRDNLGIPNNFIRKKLDSSGNAIWKYYEVADTDVLTMEWTSTKLDFWSSGSKDPIAALSLPTIDKTEIITKSHVQNLYTQLINQYGSDSTDPMFLLQKNRLEVLNHDITPEFIASVLSSSSGAGGDPYIVTLDNRLYKMQNFQGFARMVQGLHQDKLFTINTYTKLSTQNEAKLSNNYVESYFDKINNIEKEFKSKSYNYENENEAFFDKIFIQWGNEKILFDMNTLQVIENHSNFSISEIKTNDSKTFKDLDLMRHYRELDEISVEITIGSLSVILSNINNPQVKTAFRLNNGNLLTNTNGAMANTLFYKDMKLKKITDIKPITRTRDRESRKVQTELYMNTNNEQFHKKIPVF